MPYAAEVFSFVYIHMKLLIDTNPLFDVVPRLVKLGLDLKDMDIKPHQWVHWTMDLALHRHHCMPILRCKFRDPLIELMNIKFFNAHEPQIANIIRNGFHANFLALMPCESELTSEIHTFGYVLKMAHGINSREAIRFSRLTGMSLEEIMLTPEERDIIHAMRLSEKSL